jgi:two-component system sensor histidine kinase YesM
VIGFIQRLNPRRSLKLKTLLGYTLIVFLPVLAMYVYLSMSTAQQLLNGEGMRRQVQMAQATASLERELDRMEGLCDLLHQNAYVMEYLHYPYSAEWEPVYNYIKYIRPHIQYALTHLPRVVGLRIYAAKENILQLGGRFMPMSLLDGDATGYWRGSWRLSAGDGKLIYRRAISDADYMQAIGVVELTAAETVIDEYLNELRAQEQGSAGYERSMRAVVDIDGNVVRGNRPPIDVGMESGDGFALLGDYAVNKIRLERLGVVVVSIWSVSDFMGGASRIILSNGVWLVALLVVLSGVYLIFIRALIRRIVLLSRHFHGMNDGFLRPYEGETGEDEVGELIKTFNHMSLRTERLFQEVQQSERLRACAEYAAFQAKIEPHFLYGTLESIRMMADERGDSQVADTILTLSKLLRYRFSSSDDNTRWSDEIADVKRYLKLQKRRFASRLIYTFHIEDENLLNVPCAQFLLQPLIENSITHGLEKRRGEVRISIAMHSDEYSVIVRVEDDGVKIAPDRLLAIQAMLSAGTAPASFTTRDGGYALYNVNARLRLMYGLESGLTIENRPEGGVRATIRMARRHKLINT